MVDAAAHVFLAVCKNDDLEYVSVDRSGLIHVKK
jgi:hypothetical protein